MFAARSEKSLSWRWADVAARSIASIASAGRSSAAASSVSWLTVLGYRAGLPVGKLLFTKSPKGARTQDTPAAGGLPGCRSAGRGLGCFGAAGLFEGGKHTLDLL